MALGKRLINTGAAAAASCSTDSVQAFGADSTYSSNIAVYQLDGNDNDTTGNNNGTSEANVSYSSTGAKFGQAATFNGSSSYINLPDNLVNSVSGQEFTISFWFNSDDITRYAGTFSAYAYDGNNHGWTIYTGYSSSKLRFLSYAPSLTTMDFSGTTTLSASTWYHVAVTYSKKASICKLYLNGVLDGSGATTGDRSYISNHTYNIGANNNGAGGLEGYYDGKLDQIRVFSKALSEEDIATLYAETSSTASNTNPLSEGAGVALYSMDYDASEASGYYDGTSTAVDFGVEGKINYGAMFRSGSININTVPFPVNNFTISAWMNVDNIGASNPSNPYNMILTTANSSSFFYFTIDGTQLYYWENASGAVSGGTVTAGTWHHCVVTKSSATGVILYLDNTVVGSNASYTSNNTGSTAGHNTLGNYDTGSTTYPYSGKMDQVRVFSKALSATEVGTLYAETACSYTATTTDNDYPTTNAAYYKLDNSAEDEKGSYDGVETDIEYRFGRFGQAAVFNGSSSKIDLPNLGISGAGTRTISAWINISSLSAAQTIFQFGPAAAKERFGFSIDTAGKVYVEYYGRDAITSSAHITTGTWFHVAVTYNGGAIETGTNTQIYVNGVAADMTTTGSSTGVAATGNSDYGIGYRRPSTSQYFNGSIDQVRIFSSALSASQVTELYNEKPEADTSNFKAVLYEGNGGTNFVSNVGFEPDLVWVKARDDAHDHVLYDTVRGVGSGKALSSNATYAEGAYDATYGFLDTFEARGFVAKTGSSVANYTNKNNESYVAWNWKGGGDAVSNGNGTITSSVSANTAAGFSIVKWTSDGSSSVSTKGHGLSSAPELFIVKSADYNSIWMVYHKDLPLNKYIYLDGNAGLSSAGATYYSSSSTTIGFRDGSNSAVGNNMICYCWHSVAGYSKIGSYTGTGASHTLYTTDNGASGGSNPFQPSFLIIKRTDSADAWQMYDNKRGVTKQLMANAADADYTQDGTSLLSFNSNGFTLGVDNSGRVNSSSGEYIYMAFK